MSKQAKEVFIKTFEIDQPVAGTMVGTTATGFTWEDTLSEPEDEFFAIEALRRAPELEPDKEAFDDLLRKAVKGK